MQAQIQAEQTRIEHEHARQIHERELASQSQNLQARAQNAWLIVGFTGVVIVSLMGAWWLLRRRRPPVGLPVARGETHPALPPNFAPQLAQILKEAVVQGLATQRNELLQVQQAAAAEITELVRRLDKIHAPIQERLQAYESRIEELEKELAARSEENHELLKIKIELMRGQLAAERAATGDSAGFRYATSLRGKSFS
jgi:DNA repair exonuclease SbcCD ATPase subunit